MALVAMLLSMLIGAGCGLWQVEMDPSQLDQVLTNLRVNARDAINGVGMITIEAENCDVDAEYCASYVGLMPREYVRLTVCDTGSGMDATTQTQIFEPFFTTKAVGKGTGLGLATVYGAIKQNNGYIAVFSELGRGTMFEIYLPRCRLGFWGGCVTASHAASRWVASVSGMGHDVGRHVVHRLGNYR